MKSINRRGFLQTTALGSVGLGLAPAFNPAALAYPHPDDDAISLAVGSLPCMGRSVTISLAKTAAPTKNPAARTVILKSAFGLSSWLLVDKKRLLPKRLVRYRYDYVNATYLASHPL